MEDFWVLAGRGRRSINDNYQKDIPQPTFSGFPSECKVSNPRRWKKSGLCDPSDVLIIHAQSDIANSPLGDRRVLLDRNLRECTEEEDSPGCIGHTSIHKAKGLDSKAFILIGMPPHPHLATACDHFS